MPPAARPEGGLRSSLRRTRQGGKLGFSLNFQSYIHLYIYEPHPVEKPPAVSNWPNSEHLSIKTLKYQLRFSLGVLIWFCWVVLGHFAVRYVLVRIISVKIQSIKTFDFKCIF